MKIVAESMRRIATGDTDLSDAKIAEYRRQWAAIGFDMPEWTPSSEIFSSVGTALHAIIEHETGHAVPCAECAKEITALNRLTIREAVLEKERIVDGIYRRAWGHATWTEKLKLLADKAVTTASLGSVNAGKYVIGGWFNRAISKGSLPSQSSKKKQQRKGRAAVGAGVRRGRGGFASAFRAQGEARFVSSARMQEDIKTLVSMVPSNITAIAGVARSGLSVATMVSMYLHLPMLTIRQNSNDVQQTGNGWRLGGRQHVEPKTQNILIIDDTVMTGNSLRAVQPLIEKQFGNAMTAAVYVNPLAVKKPDIHAVDLPWPHLLEWNLFNSVLSPNMATDFDGILCRDCPVGSDDDGPKYLDFIENAKPLYLSRKATVPLIVTARIEKYRPQTNAWLARWGIKCKQLVMHPAKTLRERQKDNIAAYKARHFSAWAQRHRASPPPLGFIESEDQQAKEIARRTKRMVICPATARVY